jgi:hypothetical protein
MTPDPLSSPAARPEESEGPRLPSTHLSATVYLLRTMQQHHVQLSGMADNKANIMIGVSALIFSGLVTVAQRGPLTLPLQILGLGAMLAACAAVLAVMPKVRGPAPGSPGYNPLFFGCFMQKDAEGFLQDLRGILAAEDRIFASMAMDAYGIGAVLYRKKYLWLSRSYTIFLVSLLAAFATAVITG